MNIHSGNRASLESIEESIETSHGLRMEIAKIIANEVNFWTDSDQFGVSCDLVFDDKDIFIDFYAKHMSDEDSFEFMKKQSLNQLVKRIVDDYPVEDSIGLLKVFDSMSNFLRKNIEFS